MENAITSDSGNIKINNIALSGEYYLSMIILKFLQLCSIAMISSGSIMFFYFKSTSWLCAFVSGGGFYIILTPISILLSENLVKTMKSIHKPGTFAKHIQLLKKVKVYYL